MTPTNNGNTYVPDTVDRGPRLIWDKNTAAAGTTVATQVNFFAHTVSVNGEHITNLIKANTVPPPEAMLAMAIGVRISPSMLPADWIAIMNNYYWQWTIGRKVVLEALMDHYSAGVGLNGFASTNSGTAALIQSINNGIPGIDGQRRFNDYPKLIPAEVPFAVTMFLGQGGTAPALVASVASTAVSPAYGGFDCRFDVDGIYDLPVQ